MLADTLNSLTVSVEDLFLDIVTFWYGQDSSRGEFSFKWWPDWEVGTSFLFHSSLNGYQSNRPSHLQNFSTYLEIENKTREQLVSFIYLEHSSRKIEKWKLEYLGGSMYGIAEKKWRRQGKGKF